MQIVSMLFVLTVSFEAFGAPTKTIAEMRANCLKKSGVSDCEPLIESQKGAELRKLTAWFRSHCGIVKLNCSPDIKCPQPVSVHCRHYLISSAKEGTLPEARAWLDSICLQKNGGWACDTIGSDYGKRENNFAAAREYYIKGCEKGFEYSCTRLGLMQSLPELENHLMKKKPQ